MTGKEAHELLLGVTASEKPWKPNPIMTINQAIEIMQKGIEATDEPISHLLEKRVYQVVRNQRRPRF
jgi:CRISPR/Cas system-associated protein Cas7 (RAMP superfamily)